MTDDERTEVMALVCAWCDQVLREGTYPASHGICRECRLFHFPPRATSR
jgi:hypothetical protein